MNEHSPAEKAESADYNSSATADPDSSVSVNSSTTAGSDSTTLAGGSGILQEKGRSPLHQWVELLDYIRISHVMVSRRSFAVVRPTVIRDIVGPGDDFDQLGLLHDVSQDDDDEDVEDFLDTGEDNEHDVMVTMVTLGKFMTREIDLEHLFAMFVWSSLV